MKKNYKFLSIVIIIFLVTFVGCKKDTDKTLIELLIGKWEMQNAYYVYYENGVKTGENYDTFEPNAIVYEFLKNGDGKIYEGGTLTLSFTWSFEGETVTIEKPDETISPEITIENNILTYTVSLQYSQSGTNFEDVKMYTFKRI